MKPLALGLIASLCAVAAMAQSGDYTIRQIRDPVQFREKLNADMTNTDARLDVLDPLVNAAGGAASIGSNVTVAGVQNFGTSAGALTIGTNVTVQQAAIRNALTNEMTTGIVNLGTNLIVKGAVAASLLTGNVSQARIINALTNEPTTGPVYLGTNVLAGEFAGGAITTNAIAGIGITNIIVKQAVGSFYVIKSWTTDP